MNVSKAAAIWIDYNNTYSKKNIVRSYQSVIERFCKDFGDRGRKKARGSRLRCENSECTCVFYACPDGCSGVRNAVIVLSINDGA